MPNYQNITQIEVLNAPWQKELTISEAEYENGFKMLHIRIKEGKRFTDLELDVETATHIGGLLDKWVKENTLG